MQSRIAIITQPLIYNYGGILQNFALQHVLKSLGCEVTTINRLTKISNRKIFFSKIKQIFFNHHQNKLIFNSEKSKIYKNTQDFIDKYIQHIDVINPTKESLNQLCEGKFEGIVVGSDQVWRTAYVKDIYQEFFDFLEGDTKIKKYAYAASFGTDKWMFTDEQTVRCKELIQKFHAVSVREDSGVKLCNNFFNKAATCVLDPTLLLEKEVYEKICVKLKKEDTGGKNLFTYVLDSSEVKDQIISNIVSKYNYKHITNQPKYSLEGNKNIKFHLEDFIYPEIEGWIKGFRDADFIITDSFHGTVFSIIFNKPFFSIVNEERGASRFSSLLAKLGLEDRLINANQSISEDLLNERIDYDKVNERLQNLRNDSLRFIKDKLGL